MGNDTDRLDLMRLPRSFSVITTFYQPAKRSIPSMQKKNITSAYGLGNRLSSEIKPKLRRETVRYLQTTT